MGNYTNTGNFGSSSVRVSKSLTDDRSRIGAYLSGDNTVEHLVCAMLPSGNPALYLVGPNHLPREGLPESEQWPVMYGRQIAHRHGGQWYHAGGWDAITDFEIVKEIDAINRNTLDSAKRRQALCADDNPEAAKDVSADAGLDVEQEFASPRPPRMR